MPRQTLGTNKPAGTSPRFEFRYTEQERAEVESVLEPGETMSKFTREAWKMLIRSRKAKSRREAGQGES